jgi:LAO/AO transport system kinase
MDLAQSILQGSRLALARSLSLVENDQLEGQLVLNALFPHTGHAHLIGVTGAPGTGKSSLVNELARHYRQPSDGSPPRRVAIVAVDPTSPFSGGAILGDRIRMRDLSGDPGVFIRSMASRGALGGLAAATARVVQLFDAAGYDVILIETVGAGQAEIDIARLAHTTLVIEAPGLGDDIQAIKAGILEIADILVINKADHAGVENTERALRGMLELAHPIRRGLANHHSRMEEAPTPAADAPNSPIWIPPIRRTVAPENKGVQELAAEIARHRQHLVETGELAERNRQRFSAELQLLLQETLLQRWLSKLSAHAYQTVLNDLLDRRLSPRQAVERLLEANQP